MSNYSSSQSGFWLGRAIVLQHDPDTEESKPKPSGFPSIRGAWEAILFYGGTPTFTFSTEFLGENMTSSISAHVCPAQLGLLGRNR